MWGRLLDSALSAISGEEVTVEQSRPLSLTDIVGISSAAFAEKVQNYLESVQDDAPGVHPRRGAQGALAEGSCPALPLVAGSRREAG
jgi:hypothetical protein